MTSTPSLPQLQTHLALIQECFRWSTSIIAGGAVRDLLNHRPVKDIDVFIDLNEDPGSGVDLLCERLYCDKLAPKWAGDDGYCDVHGYGGKLISEGTHSGAFLVCDIPKGIGSIPTQLIFLADDPVENLKATFDFDISQAWVTRHRLWTTPACRLAMLEKRITYCPATKPNAQQRQSSRDRLERLREKYAGWSFNCVIPKEPS